MIEVGIVDATVDDTIAQPGSLEPGVIDLIS
jgi:hypothetical protein